MKLTVFLPFLSGQFTNVDVLYYKTLKSQEFENKTGNRSLLDQENLRRLTAEFEINFENELKFHNYADIKRLGRKMSSPYVSLNL